MAITNHLLIARPNPHLLSVVIPVYNEQEMLPALRGAMDGLRESLPCPAEIILVNDGSSDGSIGLLIEWARADPHVRVISLARNFGHQVAVTAGLDSAAGDAVVIMDADLQDPPQVVLDMLAEYRRGYDVVYGRRASRAGESRFKRFTAWAFYRLMRLIVHKDLPADVGDFRLVSRPCLDAVCAMRETHRFLRGMIAWVGFPQTSVSYDRLARRAGTTKYSTWKMIRFAWTAAVSFSPAPMRLCLIGGALLAAFGLGDGVYAVAKHLLGRPNVPGWTSVMAALCLIGGAILSGIGILGEYVGRIFEEVKGRPLYVVSFRANVAGHATTPPSAPDEAVVPPPDVKCPANSYREPATLRQAASAGASHD